MLPNVQIATVQPFFSGVQQGPKNYRSMIVSDNDKITYITTRKLLQLKWKYVNDKNIL